MPYSSYSGKIFCDRTVSRIVHQLDHALIRHHKVLDLGVGAGAYSDRYAGSFLKRGKFHWTGVEIWTPYIQKFGLMNKYDAIAIADAISFLQTSQEQYDICFAGDLLEHMTKEQAMKLVELALQRCSTLIVCIPIVHYPQGEFEGNPYEAHVKDDWSVEEFLSTFGDRVVSYGRENEIGAFVLSSSHNTLLRNTLQPQIAVYGICKNEMKFIDRFYQSIEDADFISIVDTGSTDGTFERLIELVRERTVHHSHEEEFKIEYLDGRIRNATDGAMQVHQAWFDPWRFDDARNVALGLIPTDADVCISIDIDEIFAFGWKEEIKRAVLQDLQTIGKPADRYHHRFSTIWNWEWVEKENAIPNATDHWHERIHSRSGYRWKLPVHEVLVKDGPENVRWLHNLKMIQKPDLSKGRSSYLRLLEQSLKEDPNRWKSWSFYAGELSAVGRDDDAIEAIRRAKQLPDSDQAFLCYQEHSFFRKKNDINAATFSILNAVALSNAREYRVWLARFYRDINKPREAMNAIMMASEITNKTDGYAYDPTCWGVEFDKLVEQLTAECKL